jgi:putative transposase
MKRPKFTEEQIVRNLQEAASGHKTQAEVCKDHGVSQNIFYLWKRIYADLETDDLRRLREFEKENEQLKIQLAERDFEISAVKKVFRKNAWTHTSELRERS